MPFQTKLNTSLPPLPEEGSSKGDLNPLQEPVIDTFPQSGFVRVKQIVSAPNRNHGFIPVCESTWWQWVKDGKAPQPTKLGPKITVWRAEDIREFANTLYQTAEGNDDA